MPRKKLTREQIVATLRQIEVLVSQGQTTRGNSSHDLDPAGSRNPSRVVLT